MVQIKRGETLTGKDRIQFIKDVTRARNDPVWFAEEKLGLTSLFPKQKEVLYEFYRHLYKPESSEYKKLVWVSGQRCLSGETLITTNQGLLSIHDIYEQSIDGLLVYNGNNWVKPKEVIHAGKKDAFKLTTEYGFSIESSRDHKFYVYNGETFTWKRLEDIEIGVDCIQINRNLYFEGTNQISPKTWEQFHAFKNQNKTKYILPIEITIELATLLGMLIADGDIASKGKIRFTKGERSILDAYHSYMTSQFGLECGEYYKESIAKSVEIYSEVVRHFLYCIGLDYTTSMTKHIPSCILNGTKDIQIAFLSGYFSCDGNVQESKSRNSKKCRITSTTVSKQLAYELQNILLGLGILSSISISKSVEFRSRIKRDNDAFTLNVFGFEIIKFYNLIKLVSTEKQTKFDSVYESQRSKRTKGKYVPIKQSLLQEWFTYHSSLYHMWSKDSKEFLIDNHSWLYEGGSNIIDQLIDPNKIFVMVKTIEDLGKSIDMYDLHVPDGNCYVANGMLVHNSGKTVLASIILCYEFFYLMSLENPAEHFGLLTLGHGKSQPIACTCVAVSSDQAKDGVYTLARNYMEGNEWFEQWWPNLKFKDDRIDLPEKNIFMQVKASRMDSAAGFTNKIVVFDELDLFAKTDSKMGARMVYDKLINSTQTFKLKGKVVAISSLQGIDGIMSELYNNGQFEDTTLTYKLESWVANPNLSKELLMEEYKYRMDAFWRDFANRPEVSTGVVFPGKVRLNKRIPNVFSCDEIPEEALYFSHALACDPAYRNDAFGMAVGYVNDSHIIIDGVNKFQKKDDNKAYINPSDIENYIFEWIPKLNVDTFLYDTDLILPTVEKLENEWGINCVKHIAGEDAYSTWVNLNDDVGEYTLDIVYDEYLEREANQLIKKELPSGKIKYDHVYNSSKDVADCCANLVWYLANNETSVITSPVIPGFATF